MSIKVGLADCFCIANFIDFTSRKSKIYFKGGREIFLFFYLIITHKMLLRTTLNIPKLFHAIFLCVIRISRHAKGN